MKKKNVTKSALLASILAMVLCVTMLVGTTFAWFTDTASANVNKIQSGTLKVDIVDEEGTTSLKGQTLKWVQATDGETKFVDGKDLLWEPGCTFQLQPFKIKNNGTLKLKYKIALSGIDGSAKLNEAIDWKITVGNEVKALADMKDLPLDPNATSDSITISGTMKTTAGNEYQNLSIDGAAVTVYAAQMTGEYDSKGPNYDAGAKYPVEIVADTTGTMTNTADESVYTYSNDSIVASVPADAVTGTEAPTVSVTKQEVPAEAATQIQAAGLDAIAYDIKIENATVDETNPATVKLLVGAGLTGVQVYHEGTAMKQAASEDAVAAGEFYYNAGTGYVTIVTDSFSPFSIAYETPVAVVNGTNYFDLQDAFNAGGTVELQKDVAIVPQVEDTTVSTLVPQMQITKDVVLNLNGHKITVDDSAKSADYGKASPLMIAVTSGTLTINGDGEINCEAGNNQVYGINVNGGNVVVNGGKFYGALTAIQVQKGSLTINDGFFDMAPTCKAAVPQYAKYVVNVIDAAFKDRSATLTVKAGTFVNFDPSAEPEGAGTTYVADGCEVVSEVHGSDTWYTVVPGVSE